MAGPYTEELVYATTDDDLLLAGVMMQPAGTPSKSTSIVWIHGNAAAFYDPPYVRFGREMAALGYPVVIGNTRGHDIATSLWNAGSRLPFGGGGGSGWERLEDAPRDLAAWVDVAAAVQPGSVVLAGHSTGAQRVVLYQAERQDARVAGLVLASPALRGFMPPGELEAAERLVAEGRGQEVTPAQPFAPWYRQSAQTVVNKAAVLSHLLDADNGEPTIAAIRSSILAFFGSSEHGSEATLAAIQRQAKGATRVDTRTIEGADHFYGGHEPEVARVIAEWIDVSLS
jgi:alpha-beta hydrolase superfamily lysophospholipase